MGCQRREVSTCPGVEKPLPSFPRSAWERPLSFSHPSFPRSAPASLVPTLCVGTPLLPMHALPSFPRSAWERPLSFSHPSFPRSAWERPLTSPVASLRFVKKRFRPSEKGFGQQAVNYQPQLPTPYYLLPTAYSPVPLLPPAFRR